MAKIILKCEQCGGNIILDDSHEIGTCEHCLSQFVIKQDQIIQKITQNITKYVYGIEGKSIEELLIDAYKLVQLGEDGQANEKFKRALDVDPNCWSAWPGYASTGGDRSDYLSTVRAYITAYNVAKTEKQKTDTFLDMVCYLPDHDLRAVFVRAFNLATDKTRTQIFKSVSGVIGCDESEIAALAIKLCPNDWRSHFAMAKFRKIRVRWCKLEGNFFTGKHLPANAEEVLNIFMQAYRLAKSESTEAKRTVLSYIGALSKDSSYSIFITELNKQIKRDE